MPLSKNDKVEILRRIALFAECTKAELIDIALNADEREAPEGDRLTEEGRRGREFFISSRERSPSDAAVGKLADLGPGDWFGEIAILTSNRVWRR